MASKLLTVVGFPGVPEDLQIHFKDNINPDLICCVCNVIASETWQGDCPHVFCTKCRDTLKRGTGVSCVIVCPLDQKSVPLLTVYKNSSNWEGVKNLLAACKNEASGCPAVEPLERWKEHIKVCCYRSVLCPQCDQAIEKTALNKHLITCTGSAEFLKPITRKEENDFQKHTAKILEPSEVKKVDISLDLKEELENFSSKDSTLLLDASKSLDGVKEKIEEFSSQVSTALEISQDLQIRVTMVEAEAKKLKYKLSQLESAQKHKEDSCPADTLTEQNKFRNEVDQLSKAVAEVKDYIDKKETDKSSTLQETVRNVIADVDKIRTLIEESMYNRVKMNAQFGTMGQQIEDLQREVATLKDSVKSAVDDREIFIAHVTSAQDDIRLLVSEINAMKMAQGSSSVPIHPIMSELE